MARKINIEEELAVCEEYKNGGSFKTIINKCGTSQSAAKRILKKYDIPIRGKGKYYINEEFFDCIDTEQKAYWLGFITADAGLNGKGRIRFNLQLGDIEHLKKFVKDTNSNYPVKELYKYDREACTLHMHNVHMSDALIKLGVTARKSLTIKPCSTIPEQLERHYWRGIFDGNGTIRTTLDYEKTHLICWRISLCGTIDIVNAFIDFVKRNIEELNSDATARKISSIYNVEFGGNHLAQKIGKLLYQDATVYLDRKKEKMNKLFEIDCREHYMQGIPRKSSRSSSKYIGVTKSSKNFWRARILVDGKQLELGRYRNEKDAAKAYNDAALKYFGPNARLNIIEDE